MQSNIAEFVVLGVTIEGEIFKPSNWVGHLLDSLPKTSSMDYSKYVRPEVIEGDESLIVRIALKDASPQAFAIIKRFIYDNGLMVRAGRGSRDTEGAPPLPYERRDPQRNDW